MRLFWLGKAAALAAVALALVWALAAVEGIVAEREGRLREAQQGVAASLAGTQTLVGPVLQRVCTERWEWPLGEGRERRMRADSREITLLDAPETLQVTGRATIEPRHRGIFRVNGYLAKLTLKAGWGHLDPPVAEHPGDRVGCVARLLVAVGDARGIRSARVTIDGVERRPEAGTGVEAHPRGLRADAGTAGTPLEAAVELELLGTEALAFAPVGERTDVRITSDWPHPSFGGRFLPAASTVGDRGFEARWQVSALSSSAASDLAAGAGLCTTAAAPASPRCLETFGVDFYDPVSPYVLSDRATKYGFLFVALTFVAVGLLEVLRRLAVHPIQYLLVGSALVIFFLLLVSLAEHLAFGQAYLAAAAACSALLAYYGTHVLGGWRPGLLFGAGIALLYGVLYVLLRQEQRALLLGALGLFGVLAAVMVATRRVDWYALAAPWRAAASAAGIDPATRSGVS